MFPWLFMFHFPHFERFTFSCYSSESPLKILNSQYICLIKKVCDSYQQYETGVVPSKCCELEVIAQPYAWIWGYTYTEKILILSLDTDTEPRYWYRAWEDTNTEPRYWYWAWEDTDTEPGKILILSLDTDTEPEKILILSLRRYWYWA